MQLKHLENKNSTIKGITLNGFSVKAFVTDDAATTTLGSSKVDFSKVTIKCILTRNGNQHVIFQDNLLLLGLASSLNTQGQMAFYQNNDHYTKLGTGRAMVGFVIPFGGCVRLKDTDQIDVFLEAQEGMFGDGYITNSFIEVKPMKAVGYETFIPQIKSFVIQGSESSNNYNFGDHVIKLALLNLNISTFLTPVVGSLAFASDRLNESYTFADLVLAKKISLGKGVITSTADDAAIFEADQSFSLVDFGQEFNQVQLDVQFNSANVATGKNYFVLWNYKTDWSIINAASQLQAKHEEKAAEAVPATVAV